MAIFKSSDPWSTIVIGLTCGLFVSALFHKGFTRDLFLEAGVFLVPVKLILMARKNAETEERLKSHLMQIKNVVRKEVNPLLVEKQWWAWVDSNYRPHPYQFFPR